MALSLTRARRGPADPVAPPCGSGGAGSRAVPGAAPLAGRVTGLKARALAVRAAGIGEVRPAWQGARRAGGLAPDPGEAAAGADEPAGTPGQLAGRRSRQYT
jgi:hypothetical protein